MNRIVAGYNPSWRDRSFWWWNRKSTRNERNELDQIKCPDAKYKVNFLEAFRDKKRRKNLSESLEVFKQIISQLPSTQDEMVMNALIVIGRDFQGLGLVNLIFRQYKELCGGPSIKNCKLLQDLLTRTADTVGGTTIKDSNDRLFYLFTKDYLKQSPYTQLKDLRESATRSTSSCTYTFRECYWRRNFDNPGVDFSGS